MQACPPLHSPFNVVDCIRTGTMEHYILVRDTHVLVYTCSYVYIHTYTHVQTQVLHTHTHTHTHKRTRTHTHTHTHTHTCTHARTHTCTHAHMHTHSHTHARTHTHTFTHTHTHTLTFIPHTVHGLHTGMVDISIKSLQMVNSAHNHTLEIQYNGVKEITLGVHIGTYIRTIT